MMALTNCCKTCRFLALAPPLWMREGEEQRLVELRCLYEDGCWLLANANKSPSSTLSKIISVDFDGCLVENRFPDIGPPIESTILALRAEKAKGATIILWTCRQGKRRDEAVDWCVEHEIPITAVNQNTYDTISRFGGDSRKIFAHEYWDDRAVYAGKNKEGK